MAAAAARGRGSAAPTAAAARTGVTAHAARAAGHPPRTRGLRTHARVRHTLRSPRRSRTHQAHTVRSRHPLHQDGNPFVLPPHGHHRERP